MWWSNLFAGMSPANFFNFSFLPKYLSFFVQGLEYTLLLSIISVGLAVMPALALALMRLSRNKIVRNLSGAYIAVFRSTPMMVQLYIIFYGLFSVIKIPSVVILGFIDLSRFIPGVVALALNSSAYVAEIIRAGILAVVGMMVLFQVCKPFGAFRRIVWGAMLVCLVVVFTCLGELFELRSGTVQTNLLMLTLLLMTPTVFFAMQRLFDWGEKIIRRVFRRETA